MDALRSSLLAMFFFTGSCLFHLSSSQECPDPGRPQFGYRIGNNFTDGANVRYVCRSGYTLLGSSTSTCTCSSGPCNWNPAQPRCIRACPNPGRLNNGVVIGTAFGISRSLQYRCSEGYRISGSSYSVCRCFGSSCRWVPPPPSCVPLECTAPENVTNGIVVGTDFRDHRWVAFHCHSGYQLNGSSHAVCRCSNSSCAWSSPPPTCIALACSDPGVPDHGSREGPFSFTAGARVRYSCDSHYHLLGSAESTCYCLPHQCQWLPAKPICTKGCEKPQPIPHCKTEGSDYSPGSSIHFHCYHGYRRKGSPSATCVCSGGQCYWDPIFPSCSELKCNHPGKPKNGYRRGRKFGEGNRISFGCRFGFDLQGPREKVCVCKTGISCRWEPSHDQDPSCIPVQATCPAPKPVAHGIVDGYQYGVGRSVQYECHSGYRLEGAETSVCTCHGHPQGCNWVPQPPRCLVMACEAPKLNNGRVIGTSRRTYASRQDVRFSCDPGYRLSDSGTRMCRCSRGGCHWQPRLPTCIRDRSLCLDPFPIVNGHVTKTGRHIGAIAVYECYYGFTLRGQQRRYCRSNGSWDGQPPVCSRQ